MNDQETPQSTKKMPWRVLFKLLSGLCVFVITFLGGLWLLIDGRIVGQVTGSSVAGVAIASYILAALVMKSIKLKR